MQVPFHMPYISDEEITEVTDSLKSGWLTMGPKTLRFEEEFRKYIGVKNAVSMNSCTACLHLALKAVNLQEGDEVIIPTLTFASTGEVITYFKATPILVDIDSETGNIDVAQIEKRMSKKTKAIIPVHFGGQPCDMDEIMELAEENSVAVIEDAAHALPAFYKERRIGTIGDITCFSFYVTKTLTTGEGGMITTKNDEWAGKMRLWRLHGISHDAWKRYSDERSWFYEILDAGYKYNMTDIQAAIGLPQLRKIDLMQTMREGIAEKYSSAFKCSDLIVMPIVRPDRKSSWHLYPIEINLKGLKLTRNQVIEELAKRNVGTSVHFIPLHRHPYYQREYQYDASHFPQAEWTYERIISLPIFPGMGDEQIDYVIDNVLDICEKWAR